ncbi:MAG: 50S ribosomal protein L17 [Haliscomenobacteraceae bacterium CHB4]|nr:50S ribosomal protein L17 [Saprospiraceae bacterium]MCE7925391.1 50S ribosomal protein L17 [Haliscomenobacteraceae bacterium CHB4]
MRHGDKVNNLGRTASHRRAMLANMAISLIEHKRITTTLAKAKALRQYVEPLVTKAKNNTTHSRRVVFSYLQNKQAINELFGPIAEKIGERPGGYMRVIKLGFRRGDGAETAMIEFVDFNETYNPNAGKVKQAKKTRRGGRKTAAAAVAAETAAPVAEAVAAEEVAEAVAEAPEVEEVVAAAEEAVEQVETAAAEVEEAAEETTGAAEEAPAQEEKKDEEQA